MLFSEIPGLEKTKQILISSVKNQHVAHAQLFMSSEGGAGLAMALAYATYINCEEKGEQDACGKCSSCIKFNKLIHPDLHFVFPVTTTRQVPKDPLSAAYLKEWRSFVLANPYAGLQDWANFIGSENKQPNISVEESRNVIRTLSMKSFEAEYKIFILWLPEIMNAQAANALLKILEEPPVKTLLLLVTNNTEKIITTILSRTQKVKIRPFRDEEIREFLLTKSFVADEKKAGQLAYLADGNANEAIRLVQEVEEDNHQLFRDWMRVCYKGKNIIELVSWMEIFQKMGREGQKGLLQYGLGILRETLICKYSEKELLRLQDEEFKFVDGFAKATDSRKIEEISGLLNEAFYHIERNANPKITFFDVSLRISSILKNTSNG